MSDQIFWYVSRSAGLVAWMAAAGSILVGVMTPSRILGRRPTIPWLVDLHRMLAALASVFLIVHLGALWFDHFVQFRLADLLVPWVATVPGLSRLSLALGVVATWFLAAVQLTSLVRDRLPPDLWRSIHLTSYAVLVLGTVHAIMAGSDIANPIVAATGMSTVTAVVLATTVRVRRSRRARRRAAGSPGVGATRPAVRPGVEPQPVTPVPVPQPPTGFRPALDWEPPSRAGTRPPVHGRPPGRPGRG
jgi:DMSO/TMAO reductase YedYZ heme-binding membrane subunit